MYKITREVEAYKQLSIMLGDREYYTDDELAGLVYSLCKKRYSLERPALLAPSQKNELARELHYDYKADNSKISRLLHLPLSAVDSMFPMSAEQRQVLRQRY